MLSIDREISTALQLYSSFLGALNFNPKISTNARTITHYILNPCIMLGKKLPTDLKSSGMTYSGNWSLLLL
jgi:hypothetical protein